MDSTVLAIITRAGIDQSRIKLYRDYARRGSGSHRSPYSKTYYDELAGTRFLVTSGLPMCDAFGQGHELTLRDKNGVIESGNNIFHLISKGRNMKIIVLSDQPGGTKKNDSLEFTPQLFLNDIEVHPFSDVPTLLESDPINPNYGNNTLEWNYGVCLRRVRIIEGRYHGYWIFTANPRADITIKYNQAGNYRLKLKSKLDDDTEFISKADFNCRIEKFGYPIIIDDSATFYPDANPETSSFDGRTGYYNSNLTWAQVHDNATGNYNSDSATYEAIIVIDGYSTTDTWYFILRGIYLFDTSGLDDSATINSAVMSLYGHSKSDPAGFNLESRVYTSDPASNTAIGSGDYDSFGTTPLCDSGFDSSSYSVTGYNDYTLNSSGLTAISKTGVTKFGIRSINDASNTPPTWASPDCVQRAYTAEQGDGYQPKLVVTYTPGGGYEVSTSDGLKMGEPVSIGSLYVGLAAADGLSGGDSPVKLYNTNPALIDGIILVETLAAIVGVTVHELSLLDGTKLSDSPISNAVRSVLAGDGYKLNDLSLIGKFYTRAVGDGLILREGDYQVIYGSQQTLTLRPNAAGDQTQCTPYGDTYNYQCIDEETTDDDTTYVYHAVGSAQYWYDLYNLPACSLSGAVIDSLKIYSRCRSTYTTPYQASYQPIRIKTHSTVYTPVAETWNINWTDYDYTYNTNPYTGSAWTAAEIDDLQIGVGMFSNQYTGYSRCTQVYIEVKYRTVTTGYYPVVVLGKLVSALDGLKLGESTSLGKIVQSTVSDGLSLSESLSILSGYGVLVSDSVKLGDSAITQQLANLLAADGIKLSEVTSALPGVALLIKVVTTKYRNAEVISALYRLIKAITTGG